MNPALPLTPISLSAPGLGPLVICSIPLEEQIVPKYNPYTFFPVQLGQIYHDRYQVLTKFGYGLTSTVWLARDMSQSSPHYVALKILRATDEFFGDRESAYTEYEISRRIANADSSHRGASYVLTALDVFELEGPHGRHVCMVYEPMRETLNQLEMLIGGTPLRPQEVKGILRVLLGALDYLHTKCHVVHTDIKKDNILFSIPEQSSFIDHFVRVEVQNPSARKLDGDYTIYVSRRRQIEVGDMTIGPPKLADFGVAVVQENETPNTHGIQLDSLRAPEVTLGVPWTYSADIWNLGVLAWEFFEIDDELFPGKSPAEECYTQEFQLAQMIALLGHPPNDLLDRGRKIETYFTSDGAFQGAVLAHQTLESRMKNTPDEERSGFANLIKKMVCWRPEDRPSAAELLEDPWLNSGFLGFG